MKIHYFDFVATGGVHTTFNSAMIEVLNKVYPENEGIILHSEKEHGKIVQEKCESEIEVNARRFVDRIKYRRIKDFINSVSVFFKILFSNNKNLIFVGLAFPFTVNSIFLSSKFFGKKVFLCLHGELQYLLDCDESIFDRKSKYYFSQMKFSFSRKNRNLNYVILGPTIYESVKHLFNSQNKIIVINHPSISSDISENTVEIYLHKPICIAQIGAGVKRKGSGHIFELAKLLKPEIEKGEIILKILGFCTDDFPEKTSELVKFYDRFLSEKQLNDEIRKIDFSLQLTTDSICTAIASGTLIDSLIFEKPVLGLHSAYLDFYLNRKQRELVCSSVNELADLIKNKISKCTVSDYKQYKESVKEMQSAFSVEYNANLFKAGLEK
ncbi:MAG: hypothetical protein PUE30_07515 [Spirochaetia bacterium]|nr:hypothetical protein [Spirochaetia bacterium]